jgi:hypothetical protein
MKHRYCPSLRYSTPFKSVQNDALQAVLDRISENVGKFYAALHPKENLDNVRLRWLARKVLSLSTSFTANASTDEISQRITSE